MHVFLTRPVALEEGSSTTVAGLAEPGRLLLFRAPRPPDRPRGSRIADELVAGGRSRSSSNYELELIRQSSAICLAGITPHWPVPQRLDTYTLDLPWSPRLVAMFDYASITADPNGEQSHTFSFLLGARRFAVRPVRDRHLRTVPAL